MPAATLEDAVAEYIGALAGELDAAAHRLVVRKGLAEVRTPRLEHRCPHPLLFT